MKCPTKNCPNAITGNARRKYCSPCRHSMAYHAKKRPAEILDYSKRLEKFLFRVEHLAERKVDFNDVSEYRKQRRANR